MTILSSTLDSSSPQAQEAAAAMKASLAEIGVEIAQSGAGGGEKFTARPHKRGQRTARGRIDRTPRRTPYGRCAP